MSISPEKIPLAELGGVSVGRAAAVQRRQADIWQEQLGPLASGMDREIREVVEQFELDASGIETASVALRCSDDAQPGALWRICRDQARASMAELARRIEPKADWNGLILPSLSLRRFARSRHICADAQPC